MVDSELLLLKEAEIKKHFDLLLKSRKDTGELQIFFSLSDAPKIFEKILETKDIPRISFSCVALAFYHATLGTDFRTDEKIENVFKFVFENKSTIEDQYQRMFVELYLLKSAFYLNKDRQAMDFLFDSFKNHLFFLDNKYAQPLLVNKIISFYEEFRHVMNLSEMEALINNMKSVMLYLISSNLSDRFPIFTFADMLVWSKETAFHNKVQKFIEKKIEETNLNMVSSSGLAYIVECKLRAGMGLDEKLYALIQDNELTLEKNYFTQRDIPYGMYLNTKYQNSVCLDTNTHLLIGFLSLADS